MKPRLLDLFCGAGGAAMGYHRAGFEVVGVDIKPQKHYPFEFHQADAMSYPLEGFDVIHASPPCQAFSDMKTMWNANKHEDLLTPIRERLKATGRLYIIENVEGAPMAGMILCGTTFGLGLDSHGAELRRHRQFETSFPMLVPPCQHGRRTVGIYGDHLRDRRRTNTERGVDYPDKEKLALGSRAMGIDWMNWKELSQSIPPAYCEFIGKQLMEYLK